MRREGIKEKGGRMKEGTRGGVFVSQDVADLYL